MKHPNHLKNFLKSFDDLPELKSARKPQLELTVVVQNNFGDVMSQLILIPGETPVHKIGEAIIEATRKQTLCDGTKILRALIDMKEIYNVQS